MSATKPCLGILAVAMWVVCVPALRSEEPATQQTQQSGGEDRNKGGTLEKLPLPRPERFEIDGMKAWRLKIPGERPLATPAVHGGLIFIGGGFGSHEFYAIDAESGELAWGFKCGDDGPTAAVVAEDCVAYNTESCTIYVHEARTGKLLWSKWLGDPLMSQPAIKDGRIYMAYPGNDGSHHLACMELKTGKALWDQKIAGEVITAPVAVDDAVYCACLEGTVYKFDAASGKPHWAEARKATSAPTVVDGNVFVSQAHDGAESLAALKDGNQFYAREFAKRADRDFPGPSLSMKAESLNAFRADDASQKVLDKAAPAQANYLLYPDDLREAKAQAEKHLSVMKEQLQEAKQEAAQAGTTESKEKAESIELQIYDVRDLTQTLETDLKKAQAEHDAEKVQDAAVAFAQNPEAAKLGQAMSNLGKNSVQGVWSYQGSRALVRGEHSYLVQGDRYRCIDNGDGKVLWEHKLETRAEATRPYSPPSEANGKHYFATADGELVCRHAKDGKQAWRVNVGGKFVFQPAVMDGKLFAATIDGTLIVLDTGDRDATGWAMWGANAAHDGVPSKE